MGRRDRDTVSQDLHLKCQPREEEISQRRGPPWGERSLSLTLGVLALGWATGRYTPNWLWKAAGLLTWRAGENQAWSQRAYTKLTSSECQSKGCRPKSVWHWSQLAKTAQVSPVTWLKIETQLSKIFGTQPKKGGGALRRKFLVIQLLQETNKQKKPQISNLTFYLEKLEKDEQWSREKEIKRSQQK